MYTDIYTTLLASVQSNLAGAYDEDTAIAAFCTNVAVVAAIMKGGLRIMPHSGAPRPL